MGEADALEAQAKDKVDALAEDAAEAERVRIAREAEDDLFAMTATTGSRPSNVLFPAMLESSQKSAEKEEADAKRKAEAARKAEVEAKRKAEAEADAKQKAEAERKAEAEAKRQAEADAK